MTEVIFTDEEQEIIDNNEELSNYDLHNLYDDVLDEIYPDCHIGGLTYSTSKAIKDVDPIAYRCGFNDWLDNEISEGTIIELNNTYYRSE